MPHYEVLDDVDLDAPVAVLALDGWIDAGGGAQRAREALLAALDTTTVATFDTDVLLDFRSRRPSMRLDDGVLTGLTWPSIELRAATDYDGNDLLLLVGAEPDHHWQSFAGDVVDLLLRFGSPLVVGLGAYPAAAPHTRPTRLASSASDARLARFASVRTTVEVPTGVQGAIERRAAEAGLDAIGLWAQVPHYVAAMPSPAAAAALVDGLAAVGGVAVPSDELHREAQTLRSRLDDLVAGNPEHVRMVRELEEQWDGEESGSAPGMGLVSGDEIAAEFERFLREQDDG